MTPLVLGLPSKGRLKEQVEAWLADCGLPVQSDGGRGYTARIAALPGLEVRLASASEIATSLLAGDLHLGVTGEDLLREATPELEAKVELLRPLGFGRADLVVAAPQSWIDVTGMADLADVAAAFRRSTGKRLRVATKYLNLTHRHLIAHGVSEHRIVESLSATEGAPAAGLAEVVVDITTTGRTLADNRLKILDGGLILKSQAQLCAALGAVWTADQLAVLQRLLSVVEARARAKAGVRVTWPAAQDAMARAALADANLAAEPGGVFVAQAEAFDLVARLESSGVCGVSIARSDYVFEGAGEGFARLRERLFVHF